MQGGKRYAFMVGFSEPAEDQNFTLGNTNDAGSPDAPALRMDVNGNSWWSIRREGNGTLPPTQIPGTNPPSDPQQRSLLETEALFGPDYQRELSPTTDGFPDVDTYRSLEFYIELTSATNSGKVALEGKNELLMTKQARIYPNPNHSQNITVELPGAKPVVIRLYNEIGQQVFQRSYSGQSTIQIDRSHFSRGIHFLQISSDKETEVVKVAIQ